MTSPIIPDDTITLIKQRDTQLVSPASNGMRKISVALLSPPSSASSRSALSSSATTTTATHETQYITIPTHLESAATFNFLGFTEERAKFLIDGRASRQATQSLKISVLDWAVAFVQGTCSKVLDQTDDWDSVMVQAGIKSEIRQAFAKPEHEQIRLVQPLSEWLVEIVQTNYYALIDMNATILHELAPKSPRLRGGDGEPYDVPKTPRGHLAVFKSVEFRRAQGCISEDGSVNLGRLESTGPTDFCRRGGLYFTPQLWVASHYSALITDACPVADRRAVELHVPLSHFASVKTLELTFEDDWKKLLYFSRRDDKYPKEISQLRAEHGVIHGPIGHCHNLAFGKMISWSDITDKHQLHSKEKDGEEVKIGKQYVWIKESAVSQLEEDVKGKVFIRKPEQGFKLVPQPWKDESVKLHGL